MDKVFKFLSFVCEAALVIYATWLIFQDNPTLKQVTFLCAITFIQSLINEGKLNAIKDKLLKSG